MQIQRAEVNDKSHPKKQALQESIKRTYRDVVVERGGDGWGGESEKYKKKRRPKEKEPPSVAKDKKKE